MTHPSDDGIAISREAHQALQRGVPCVSASFSSSIKTLLSETSISQAEWKDLHGQLEKQITADRMVVSLREAQGKKIGAVIAVALFATLFFAVPAIAGTLWFLLLSAFVISLMTVGICLVTLDWINREELERTHALEMFLKRMPQP